MRKYVLSFMLISFLIGCGNNKKKNEASSNDEKTEQAEEEVTYDKVDGEAVDMDNKGVGPIESVTLDDEIDQDMADRGKEVYDGNCLACHKPDKKLVGPAPKGILDRRAPEWIMNMIMDPEKMVKEDPI